MTRIEWDDLSDSELRSRLENRGVSPALALLASMQRERPKGRAFIERVLRP